MPLTQQEILNAVYSGPFVTLAREEFSNSQNSLVQKWSAYISGDVKRQAYLECALDWVSGGAIDNYMSKHRRDDNIVGNLTAVVTPAEYGMRMQKFADLLIQQQQRKLKAKHFHTAAGGAGTAAHKHQKKEHRDRERSP